MHPVALRFYRDLLRLSREFPSFQTRAFIVHQTRVRFREPLAVADDGRDGTQELRPDLKERLQTMRLEAAHAAIEVLENARIGDNGDRRYLQDVVDGFDPLEPEEYDLSEPPRGPTVSPEADAENERKFGAFLYPHNLRRVGDVTETYVSTEEVLRLAKAEQERKLRAAVQHEAALRRLRSCPPRWVLL